jgi:hypothetical protein
LQRGLGGLLGISLGGTASPARRGMVVAGTASRSQIIASLGLASALNGAVRKGTPCARPRTADSA